MGCGVGCHSQFPARRSEAFCWYDHHNRPFPRCRKPLFQNEAKCKTFLVKMIFYYHANKTHLYKKSIALDLGIRVRVFRTRKWPIRSDLLFPFFVFCFFFFLEVLGFIASQR